MMTMLIYEVYTLASYFKDNCFNVFLSCQSRYCLELKNKTMKMVGIYIYVCVCVCVCVRARACVCLGVFIILQPQNATVNFVTNIHVC
jgi:hypothetical protein